MIQRLKNITVYLMAGMLAGPAAGLAEDFTRKVEKPIRESVAIRQETQQATESWQAEKEKRIAAYEALETRKADLLAARTAGQKELERQRARNRDLADQLAKLEAISRDIEPFLEETHTRLAKLLKQEPALLPEERGQRLERLQALLQDPAVDIGEKYRKAMEAFFIEAEYGNTVDVYQQPITVEKQPVTVTIFRLGRLALFYQSMDAKSCGYYDRGAARWLPLENRHNRAIRAAIEIVRKQRPAEMVNLPIGRVVAR